MQHIFPTQSYLYINPQCDCNIIDYATELPRSNYVEFSMISGVHFMVLMAPKIYVYF